MVSCLHFRQGSLTYVSFGFFSLARKLKSQASHSSLLIHKSFSAAHKGDGETESRPLRQQPDYITPIHRQFLVTAWTSYSYYQYLWGTSSVCGALQGKCCPTLSWRITDVKRLFWRCRDSDNLQCSHSFPFCFLLFLISLKGL